MGFISKDDIIKYIDENELNAITSSYEPIVLNAISTATAEVKSHLHNQYDTDLIFSKTGEERDALLVQFICDIAIYNIVAISQAGQDFEDREARYKRALAWIKAASKPVDSKDRIYPDLPLREETKEKVIFSSSKIKRENYY
jgi:phage gp36-like protein